ncbi:MAG: hypothetical protein Q8L37_03805 [Candidatus Gottesmanbacteria bacterium]|nr:hypothetical protein [Candidatus Gottesmanbacteria bacterium]
MMTINISLPKTMYEDAKAYLARRGYSSMSELFRDTLRDWLYPRLTENGFTPEFEAEVLKSAAEPIENDVEWDGVTPFHKFVMSHLPKRHGKRTIHRSVPSKLQKSGTKRFEPPGEYHPAAAMV